MISLARGDDRKVFSYQRKYIVVYLFRGNLFEQLIKIHLFEIYTICRFHFRLLPPFR